MLVVVDDIVEDAAFMIYREFVKKNNLLNSLLVGNSAELYSYDLLLDRIRQVFQVDFSKKHLRQVHGWPFKVENPKNGLDPGRAKQILTGSYYMLLKEFSVATNATLQWILPESSAPNLVWFLENQIDVILHAPFLVYPPFEFLPEYHLEGICLIVPEQLIGAYVHHLLKPFKTSLWLLILVIISVVVGFNIRIRSWCQKPLFWQILFGVGSKAYKSLWFERAALCVLFWLKFILSECYSNKMIAFMFNTRYQPHMQSLEDFYRTNAVAVIPDNEHTRQIPFPNKLVFREKLDELTTDENYLILCDWAQTYINSIYNVDPNTRLNRFYMIPEMLVSTMFSNVFLSSSIFAVQFKLSYDKFFEAGIWNHWVNLEGKDLKQQDELLHLELTYDDLISIWLVLLVGAAAGGTALLLEIAFSHRRWIQSEFSKLKKLLLKLLKKLEAALKASQNAIVNAVQLFKLWYNEQTDFK